MGVLVRRKKRREEVDKYKGEKIKKTKVLLLTKVNHYKRRKKKKDPRGCTKKWTPKGTKKMYTNRYEVTFNTYT